MVSVQEMQRQIVAFGFEEARNRALDEAVFTIEHIIASWRWSDRRDAEMFCRQISALKRDPTKLISDWWEPEFSIPKVPPLIPGMAD